MVNKVRILMMRSGQQINNKSKVFIAIADVSFYVQDGDPLDQEAKKEVILFIFLIE